MNINDIKDTEEIPKNIWEAIFKKQLEVARKYQDIEGMGDLLDRDDNIQTSNGQKWIKDFAWRTTEELAEAYEAVYQINGDTNAETYQELLKHFKEELIDALHFLVEMTIIANHVNFKPHVVEDEYPNPWKVVYELGLMCNTLKNKPWKQSQMLTDQTQFTKHLNNAWTNFYALLRKEVGSDEDIYNFYFKKNEVNKFRIRSKY